MQIVIELLAIFLLRAVIDIANMFTMYDRFLFVKTRKVSKCVWLNTIIMFAITLWFWLINVRILNASWMTMICFPLYYTKAILVLWCFYPKRIKDLAMLAFYEVFVAALAQQVRKFFFGVDDRFLINGFRAEISELIIAVILLAVLWILYCLKRNNIIKLYIGELTVFQYIIFGVTLAVASFLQVYILNYSNDFIFKLLTFSNILLISCLIIHIIVMKEADVRKGRVIDILEEQMDKVTGYYNEVIEVENKTKKFRHDIKNLLIALHSLVEVGNNDKALEYIEALNDMCRKSSNKYDTGNFIADTMLRAKQAVAEEKEVDITFEGNIPSNMENVDLVILLSNILDNAIEACEKVTGAKIISVNSVLNKKMWILVVKNPTSNKVKIYNNKIDTTKDDKEIHGFGIQNMERVVERYNGSLNFECEDNVFCVKAMLQINM